MNLLRVGDVTVGDGDLTIIAGPCVAESQDLCDEVAGKVQEMCKSLGLNFIFKAAYDKANRSSGGTFRGHGIDKGLEILGNVKSKFKVPVTSDFHLPSEAAIAAPVVDLLQI